MKKKLEIFNEHFTCVFSIFQYNKWTGKNSDTRFDQIYWNNNIRFNEFSKNEVLSICQLLFYPGTESEKQVSK